MRTVKKCMEFRDEGSRQVGRSIRTWLESVEARFWPNLRSTRRCP